MNQLIASNQVTMSSRDIASLLNSRHADVCVSIKRLMDAKAISEYAAMPYTHEQNKQTYYEYFVSKRDSYVIVAQLSPQFTAALVDRWQELEMESSRLSVPQTYAAALLEAGRLALEVEKRDEQLKLAAPKVEFVDKYVERSSLQTATQVAATFGMSAMKMNKLLDEAGGVYDKRIKRSRAFCADWIAKGYGETKQNEQGYSSSLFTPAGIMRVTEIFTSEGVI